ncbi:MAG: hypothetical protein KGZ65_03430 [Sphingomonadales bacterium]|nr:hypothetical protein [Sphingomonadaceae bacterium]MBS3930261.1 hypothetical protein [Sphingomonadales bacterium]
MKPIRRAAILAASLTLVFASPVAAQNDPLVPGEYVEVGSITIDDGHYMDYANFLAGTWKSRMEYAKSQGWITGYEVLANVNKRPGEPDLILVTRFKSMPDSAEQQKRDSTMRAYLKQTDSQLEAASGERAKYRKQLGSQLWQVLGFR